MLSTCIEKFADVMEEMKTLNMAHYHEISEHAKHGVPLDPDYTTYLVKEERGELLFVSLREAGKLIGYYIGFYVIPLHYKSILEHKMDIIYVEATSRGKKCGAALLNMVQAECKRRGVRLMTTGFKEAHRPYMERLLIECGMQPFETHYCLWFDNKG